MSTLKVNTIQDTSGNPRGFSSYAVISDQKANGEDGGSSTEGGWRTRDLNTELHDPSGIVSISSNQFTLQAGTYLIQWVCPAYATNRHRSRCYNSTDGTDVDGHNAYIRDSDGSSSSGWARFSITSAKVFEIQHQVGASKSGNGFGVETIYSPWSEGGGSNQETFTVVAIFKQ